MHDNDADLHKIVFSASPEPAGGVCGLLRARVPRCVPPHGVPRPQTQEEAAAAGPEQRPVTTQPRESIFLVIFIIELFKKINHNKT